MPIRDPTPVYIKQPPITICASPITPTKPIDFHGLNLSLLAAYKYLIPLFSYSVISYKYSYFPSNFFLKGVTSLIVKFYCIISAILIKLTAWNFERLLKVKI